MRDKFDDWIMPLATAAIVALIVGIKTCVPAGPLFALQTDGSAGPMSKDAQEARRARARAQVADLKGRLRRAREQRRELERSGRPAGRDIEARIRELKQELAEWRMMQ